MDLIIYNSPLIYLVPIFSLLIILILFGFRNHYKFILGAPVKEIRKIHTKPIIKIGGISLISICLYLFFIKNTTIINSILFSLCFLTLGTVADLNKYFNSKLRFVIMLIILIIFILSNNFFLHDLDHELLNNIFLFSPISSFLFILFALMFIINGFNFIDGNNGLLLGVTLLILFNFAYYTNAFNSEIYNYILCIGLAVSVLFIINFLSGNIICGDGGAYYLGFLVGTLSVILSNYDIIYATKVACIIFYPVFELFFTFWRRIFFEKSSPFEPDDLHLHSLFYKILIKLVLEH